MKNSSLIKTTNPQTIRILLADSDQAAQVFIRALIGEFKINSYQFDQAVSRSEVLAAMRGNKNDVYLIGYRFGITGDADLLQAAMTAGCTAPVIILTENYCDEIKLELIKAGATECLAKDQLDAQSLEIAILSSLKYARSVQTLRENEMIHRNFTESLPVMIYAVEPHPPYLPIYISPAFESFGYPLEEWRQTDLWLKILHPDDRERVLAETQTAMIEGIGTDCEYRLRAGDGTLRRVHDCGCFVRDESGRPLYWQGVILDITERRQTEERLRLSDERYRQMFEKNLALQLLIDTDSGQIVDANPSACDFYGYPLETFQTKNIKEINTLPAFEVADEMKRAANEQRNYFIFQHRLATGELRDVEVLSSPLNYQNRKLLYSIIRDVTERKQADEALKESETRFRDLFENANDLIYTHDLQGNFTSINHACEITTGYSRREALRMNVSQIIAPEYLELARTHHFNRVDEKPVRYELEIIAKDNRRVPLELSARLIFQGTELVGVQGVARDITERKQAVEELHKTVSLLTSTIESTADGIIVVDKNDNITIYNRRFAEMWQIPPQLLADRNLNLIRAHIYRQLEDPELFIAKNRQLYLEPTTSSFDQVKFKDGRVFERYSKPQTLEGETVGRVWSFRDITERMRAEEQLEQHALFDTLTNLPNRAQFMSHLKQAIHSAAHNSEFRFAVLFLDLDRFKVINDSLGHLIGDKLLIAFGEQLKASVRPNDVVARLGGDEFTILLHIKDNIDAVNVAERLQQILSEPFIVGAYEVFTSASIGIIISDDIHRQPEDFLRDADAAMYRAKESGKARYEIFDSEMHIRNMNLLQIENNLRRALERNEFRVFYQPVVSLETGEIRELEALIRWEHPEHGLILPNDFISVAEETGLIISIGNWVLEEACRQTRRWQQDFSSAERLSVSVNLSAKQLMHPALTSQVKEILAKTGLAARALKLEVTESMVMEYSEKALNVISELRALGISFSTDDFGTGYSSLSYLHRFPFERLKIDRSFISKMNVESKSEAIVRTILLLGQNLNIEVVAEGIETELQLERLRALGCQLGQGYLFAKPIAAHEIEKLLADNFSTASFVNM